MEITGIKPKSSIVVYTAIFGCYDDLWMMTQPIADCDFVCFTDDLNLKSDSVDIRYNRSLFIDPARDAKYYKVFPHRFFPEYQYSIWIDGSITVKSHDIQELVDKCLKQSDWAVFPHPERDCIYEEMEACAELKKDDFSVMEIQTRQYRDNGYPPHNGLVENSVLIRRHNRPEVVKICEAWWAEIEKYSRRDQLSFNYVVWKNNYQYALLDGSVDRNLFFEHNRHLRQNSIAVHYGTASELAKLNDRKSTLESAVVLLEGHIETLMRQMDDLVNSLSWRVTRPLRSVSRLFHAMAAAGSVELRIIYKNLPLSEHSRQRLKAYVFSACEPLIRHTQPYRAWASFKQMEAPRTPINKRVGGSETDSDSHKVRSTALSKSIDFVEFSKVELPSPSSIRLIAFYLPQFHPIPENDAWWGKGFTEWSNVVSALPQFEGHYQPHLPADLGFYDLRIPDVQRQQVDLAKAYGIEGFCFYFYWFGGKTLLEHPIRQYLKHPEFDLPFCLCWANENWSRRWDGLDRDILIAQGYSKEDDLAFIEYIAEYLRDPRYIRVMGRPLLVVYRPGLLPDPRKTAKCWRDWCRNHGIGEIYLAYTQSFEIVDPAEYNFDAAIEFPPNNSDPPVITDQVSLHNPYFSGIVCDWRVFIERSRNYDKPLYTLFRGVNPSWDNEARRTGRGTVFANSSPAGYKEWLRNACLDTAARFEDHDNRLVFINAWNEWAEGAHLEPDRRFGCAYLHATAAALRETHNELQVAAFIDGVNAGFVSKSSVAVHLHLFYEDLTDDIFCGYLDEKRGDFDMYVSVGNDVSLSTLESVAGRTGNVFFLRTENRGRDIRPFIIVLEELLRRGYEFACKIHSKKSPHRVDGHVWRHTLIAALLNGGDAVRQAVTIFRENPDVGMLVPEGSMTDLAAYEIHAGNIRWLDVLLKRLACESLVGNYAASFPAGSMYWFRVEALSDLADIVDVNDEFEPEIGQLDGTLAHAIERVIGLVPARRGYRIMEICVDARRRRLLGRRQPARTGRSANGVNVDIP